MEQVEMDRKDKIKQMMLEISAIKMEVNSNFSISLDNTYKMIDRRKRLIHDVQEEQKMLIRENKLKRILKC